jgi:mannose-6-phosphate isomerase-like protein (cupin superfamily)
MIISKENAEHYLWGGDCDGWRLVNRRDMSVIHERMPPGRAETRHYHERARQFFFVLSGALTLEVESEINLIVSGCGLEVEPLARHQAINTSDQPVEFLVVSCPAAQDDRVASS